MKRQPGYYRVKYLGVWYLGFYIGNLSYPWELKASDGDIMRHQDSAFDEIIDTPVSPEPQQVTYEEIWECISKHSGIEVDYLKSRREVLSISVKGIVEIMRTLLSKNK
jgi:hypothetical protein